MLPESSFSASDCSLVERVSVYEGLSARTDFHDCIYDFVLCEGKYWLGNPKNPMGLAKIFVERAPIEAHMMKTIKFYMTLSPIEGRARCLQICRLSPGRAGCVVSVLKETGTGI